MLLTCRRQPWSLLAIASHSLLPLVALALLLLLPLIGPWWFGASAFAWWRLVTWIG